MNKVLKLAFKPVDYILNWPEKDNKFLQGVYGPVQEEVTTQECEVVGELPEAVFGEFARNGPNPRFVPKGGYHWFDGDGMVHAVRLKSSGSASYSNRYVKTNVLKVAEQAGEAVGVKMGDMADRLFLPKMMLYNLKVKLGLVPDFLGMHEANANTSLVFHAGRLMALCEGGLPYALRVMCEGVIETLGVLSFDGKMQTSFTAHPKKDVSTGKLYGFGYQMDKKPYLTMYVLDAEGKLERQFPIDVERPTLMHDMAITENHAIFLDLPLVFKPENMVKGVFPIVFDDKQYARMGVLPLNATDDSSIRWFDMPEAFVAFHVLNAWEEKVQVDGTTNAVLKVVTCDMFELDLDQKALNQRQKEGAIPRPHTTTINLDTGKVTRACIIPHPPKEGLDFPQLNRAMVGRENRYGFFVGFDAMEGLPTAIVKLDLKATTPETAEVGRIDLGDWAGGEALFVPKHGEGMGEGEEDDGFLVSFTSPVDVGNSELRVWDAKTMNPDPLAIVKLPARVPLGFHAIFLAEADLAAQKPDQ
eukprot:g6317.t1